MALVLYLWFKTLDKILDNVREVILKDTVFIVSLISAFIIEMLIIAILYNLNVIIENR